MQYWVCYDIGDDRRRERLVHVLLDYGSRMEESVFACILDSPTVAEEMMGRIERVLDRNQDRVHVLRLCDGCSGRTVALGQASRPELSETLIV